MIIDVLGDVLRQAVAKRAQLAALSMNFPWVIAVAALPRVAFKVIERPRFSGGRGSWFCFEGRGKPDCFGGSR